MKNGSSLVLFAFTMGMVFIVLRAGMFKESAQIYITLLVAGLSLVASSLIMAPGALPTAGLGKNKPALVSAGLLLGVLFFAIPMSENIHPYLSMHIAAQQFKDSGMIFENFLVNGAIIPMTEVLVFLSWFYVMTAWFKQGIAGAAPLASGLIVSTAFAFFNFVAFPMDYQTVPGGLFGFFQTTLGISTVGFMGAILAIGYYYQAYLVPFTFTTAVHSGILLVATGYLSTIQMIGSYIILGGALYYDSVYRHKGAR